jgi:SAM-dependent methyltransferase
MVFPVGEDRVLLYQGLLRQGVLTDFGGLAALSAYLTPGNKPEQRVRCRDVSTFSLSECLLDNPAGIDLDEGDLVEDSFGVFLELLQQHDLLVFDLGYRDKVGRTQSLFDQEHTGNFHQQIGKHLFDSGRADPARWWIDQKFEADLSGPRDTPYRWVQQQFLEEFFPDSLDGQSWLDFGCGVGFYSDFFGQKGARVLGVDPSLAYIDIAVEQFSADERVAFECTAFNRADDFGALEGRRFDHIFLCDVFLYYFEPYEEMELTPAGLLQALRELLLPGGSIYILDPHGCFHLQPWIGGRTPSVLCTEYRHRKYRVTPTLEEVSRAAEDAGLQICRIRELTHEGDETDRQSRNVTREFPLWWFFELKVAA